MYQHEFYVFPTASKDRGASESVARILPDKFQCERIYVATICTLQRREAVKKGPLSVQTSIDDKRYLFNGWFCRIGKQGEMSREKLRPKSIQKQLIIRHHEYCKLAGLPALSSRCQHPSPTPSQLHYPLAETSPTAINMGV